MIRAFKSITRCCSLNKIRLYSTNAKPNVTVQTNKKQHPRLPNLSHQNINKIVERIDEQTDQKEILKDLKHDEQKVQITLHSKYDLKETRTENFVEIPELLSKNRMLSDELEETSNYFPDTSYLKKEPTSEIKFQPHQTTTFENLNEKFNQRLLAFVKVCLGNKDLRKKAYEAIEFHERQKDSNDFRFITNIEIYNQILLDKAKSSTNLKNILHYFKVFRERKLEPNIHSYAICLYGIYNVAEINKKFDHLYIHRILEDIEKFKFDLNEISHSNRYSYEQLEIIEKTIKLVRPDFKFKLYDYNDESTHNLLDGLNRIILNDSNDRLRFNDVKIDPVELKLKVDTQIQTELETVVHVKSILKIEKQQKDTEKLEKIKKIFNEQIIRALKMNINELKNSRRRKDLSIYPFIASIQLKSIVELLLQEIENLSQFSANYSPSFNLLRRLIGEKFEMIYNRSTREEDIEKLTKVYKRFVIEATNDSETNQRKLWTNLLKEEKINMQPFDNKWPRDVHLDIGEFLYSILLNHVKVDSKTITNQNGRDINAIFQIYRNEGIYKYCQIKLLPELVKYYNTNNDELVFESNRMPMITTPIPWSSLDVGGYCLTSSNLLRINLDKHLEQYKFIQNSKPNEMYPIYDSLNLLSSCPWKINTTILDLLIEVFNSNTGDKLGIPMHSSRLEVIPMVTKNLGDRSEYIQAIRKKEEIQRLHSENFSLWCTELYRLSIANNYRNDIIWFPHSLDFRGRAYPIPPHFSHIGNDIARSLILFAEKRPLGEKGLDMLKIHCINLTGTKKRSTISERLEFANSIIEDILDSANKPFNGRLWWQKSEEPWQTLACCMEINNAIKSEDPSSFLSNFPIHQDGSCNGLQHYAALGRDEKGAFSVNLSDSHKPQDVYSDIADLVELKRKEDEKTEETARVLNGFIGRKVIKQTVMTTVYNVTMYGAKLQILRQLEMLEKFPKAHLKKASQYLANSTFQNLNEVFESARKIQQWLSDCAFAITKLRGHSVIWVTPLGLIVVQPYYDKNVRVSKIDDKVLDKIPNCRKQRAGFPPNFVHSLDSTHMMLTSLYCQKENIRFVSVHDCFWTHACDTDKMNKICREQFVKLHSLPLLENLAKFFQKNFSFTESEIQEANEENLRKEMINFNELLTRVPKKGNFDLNRIKKSIYFFS